MGCHFLLQCRKVKSESEVAQSCPTLRDPMDCSLPRSSVHDFLGKSTAVGCHFLLQRIFSTQGSNPGLPHCRQIIYQLSYKGSPIKHLGDPQGSLRHYIPHFTVGKPRIREVGSLARGHIATKEAIWILSQNFNRSLGLRSNPSVVQHLL